MMDAHVVSEAGRESESVTLVVLLEILRLGKRTILLAALLSLLLAAILAFMLPLRYTAITSFLPSDSNTPSTAAAMMSLSSLGNTGLLGASRSQADLYVGILKSSSIARTLVNQFNLKTVYKENKESAAEKILTRLSTFNVGTKDPIVTIQVTDTSPERAAALARGYLRALEDKSSQMAATESSQRRQFYEQRVAKEKEDLASAELKQKQDQEESGMIAPAVQTASLIERLAQMQAQITDRQAQLAAELHDETGEGLDVIHLRTEIGSLQGQVAQLQNGQHTGSFGVYPVSAVPSFELDYVREDRDVKYHEALLEIIAKQYEAARLDEARSTPLQILDAPVVPDTKSGPPRSLIVAVGLVMGLLGGTALVVFQASRRHRLSL